MCAWDCACGRDAVAQIYRERWSSFYNGVVRRRITGLRRITDSKHSLTATSLSLERRGSAHPGDDGIEAIFCRCALEIIYAKAKAVRL